MTPPPSVGWWMFVGFMLHNTSVYGAYGNLTILYHSEDYQIYRLSCDCHCPDQFGIVSCPQTHQDLPDRFQTVLCCGHCQRKLHLLLQDLVDVLSVYLDSQNHSSDYKNTSFYPCCPSFWVWCAFLICKQNMLMSYTHVLYFLQSSGRNDQFDGVQQNRWNFEHQFAYALSSNMFSCCVLLSCLLFVINSAMCIAQLLQILEVMMDFFGFTTNTDHTAAHGKAVIILDSLVLISVFFVQLSIQKQLIQNVMNTSNKKLL